MTKKRWDEGNNSTRPTWSVGTNRDYGTETESWAIWQDDCIRDGYSLREGGSKFRRSPAVKNYWSFCRDGCSCNGENNEHH